MTGRSWPWEAGEERALRPALPPGPSFHSPFAMEPQPWSCPAGCWRWWLLPSPQGSGSRKTAFYISLRSFIYSLCFIPLPAGDRRVPTAPAPSLSHHPTPASCPFPWPVTAVGTAGPCSSLLQEEKHCSRQGKEQSCSRAVDDIQFSGAEAAEPLRALVPELRWRQDMPQNHGARAMLPSTARGSSNQERGWGGQNSLASLKCKNK